MSTHVFVRPLHSNASSTFLLCKTFLPLTMSYVLCFPCYLRISDNFSVVLPQPGINSCIYYIRISRITCWVPKYTDKEQSNGLIQFKRWEKLQSHDNNGSTVRWWTYEMNIWISWRIYITKNKCVHKSRMDLKKNIYNWGHSATG